MKQLLIVVATSRPQRSGRRLIGDKLAHRYSLVILNGAPVEVIPAFSGFGREAIPTSIVENIIKLIPSIKPECEIIMGYEKT